MNPQASSLKPQASLNPQASSLKPQASLNPQASSLKPQASLARYARQMRYAPLGEEGQRRLCASRALVVGCGALGTVLANTLVRAGVGHVRIVDRDFVELTNLQRQVLF